MVLNVPKVGLAGLDGVTHLRSGYPTDRCRWCSRRLVFSVPGLRCSRGKSPSSAALSAYLRVRYEGYSRRASVEAARQKLTRNGHLQQRRRRHRGSSVSPRGRPS
jgi:hypothetical protein